MKRISTHTMVQAATAACASTIWLAHVMRPELEAIAATFAALVGVLSVDFESIVRKWRAHRERVERELESEL